MEVLSSWSIKKGARAKESPMAIGAMTMPIQFLERQDKDPYWVSLTSDFIEFQGLKQLQRNATRLLKNYKLANGIIDRGDYIPETDNEYRELVGILEQEQPKGLELSFYPLIPPIINTFCSEFSKRNTKLTFYSTDEFSQNEKDALKISQISDVLMADAEKQMLTKMIEQGLDPSNPEVQEQMKQQLSPENLKTLPEIHNFFSKSYRSLSEEWAMHQYHADTEHFKLDELEERSFRNSLITDREFWHFRMMEDDYDIELWNPVTTFYHKSPSVRYMSQAHWIGNIDMLTISDVIDKYGHMMTQTQLESLEVLYPVRAAGYAVGGLQNDGSYYDATRSHEWNTDMPGLSYRQLVTKMDMFGRGRDVINWINGQSEDFADIGSTFLLRVSTMYWKSQRKVGHLTKIKENGETITDIVDESYIVTDKPIYNNLLIKNKNADTLVFGEHIDWIWINQTWGVVKIGPNHPSWWGMKNPNGLSPMYLGVNSNNPGPLKFQFKGDKTLYGCKLPVEGCVYSDYNTRSTALIDLLKPHQVGFNMVNNQIADILIDEIGTIVVLDQNSMPQHSLGEDWGKNNYAKGFVMMKNFQILPRDTSVANMEGQISAPAVQQLDMSQTQRLLSRVQLANHFKQEAYASIGITPQRMGAEMGRQTATGVEENLNASYAQTETYFTRHCDYLMPRVHQMRTDLAQFYHSTKPSVRLQYITTKDERVNFEINGTDLLNRDIGVVASTDALSRSLLEEFKKEMLRNNTAGATVYDLGALMFNGDSKAEVMHVLKSIEEKTTQAKEQERQHELQMQQEAIEAEAKEKELAFDREAILAANKEKNNIIVAEIRAAGYGAGVDKDANMQNDYLDALGIIQKQDAFQQQMDLEKTKEQSKQVLNLDKQAIQREKMATQRQIADTNLQIARENLTKNEIAAKKKAKESKKK